MSEAFVAIPAAGIAVATGIISIHAAGQRLSEIGPTVAFLAAILVFGHLCAEAGVFAYLGSLAARVSNGRPRRLLVIVVALASAVTAARPDESADLPARRARNHSRGLRDHVLGARRADSSPADDKPRALDFHLLGVATVPPILLVCTAALWGAVQVIGV